MNARLGIAATVVAIAALAGAMALHLDSPAASAAQPQVQGQDTSTLDDQTELALTVYNSDLGLVRDVELAGLDGLVTRERVLEQRRRACLTPA